MDRFHSMNVFVAVAEAESFAGGARRLKMSPPAVTRAVGELEERLGVRLLTRTTRVVRLTDAGARYLEDVRRILVEVEEADAAAVGVNAVPRGHLMVTAPVLFGKLYVMPIVTEFQSTYDQVGCPRSSSIVSSISLTGMDVGIRIGQMPDSSLACDSRGTGTPSRRRFAGLSEKRPAFRKHRRILPNIVLSHRADSHPPTTGRFSSPATR